MTDYKHDTTHDATKRLLIDCIAELYEVKSENSANIETLSSVRTEVFETKQELNKTAKELALVNLALSEKNLQAENYYDLLLQTKEELCDTKERLSRANTLIRQLAIRTTPIGTEASSPYL